MLLWIEGVDELESQVGTVPPTLGRNKGEGDGRGARSNARKQKKSCRIYAFDVSHKDNGNWKHTFGKPQSTNGQRHRLSRGDAKG